MEIDLRKVKTVCISLKESKRRKNITRMMESLSFENWSFFDGIEKGDPVEGCALSHVKVLQENLMNPVLIIEDDAEITEDFVPIINIPENIDAVYLGYSWWSWTKDRALQSRLKSEAIVQKQENWYKIGRITSAHAILYLDWHHKKYLCENITKYLLDKDGNRHCDVIMGETQLKFHVIAPPKPFFFQMCERNSFWTTKGFQNYKF